MLTTHSWRLFRALGYLLVSAVLLWLVWRWFDGAQALSRLKTANIYWLFLALALLTTQLITSALRWQLTATQLQLPLTKKKAIGQYYLSMLCNLTLPGGVMGDAGRAWYNRAEMGLVASAAAVMLDRLAGQLAMIVALALGLLWQGRTYLVSHGWWWLGAIAATVALFKILRQLKTPAWVRRLANLTRAAWLAPGIWQQQLALTLLILACNLLAFYACAQAVGVSLQASSALLILPATLLVMALPVSVAGWGLREAAAALIWPVAGVASDIAVAASVAYGIVATASAMPGLYWIKPSPKPSD